MSATIITFTDRRRTIPPTPDRVACKLRKLSAQRPASLKVLERLIDDLLKSSARKAAAR